MINNSRIKRIVYKSFKSKITVAIAITLILAGITLTLNKVVKNITKPNPNTILLETHANEVSEWQYKIGDKTIIKLDKKKRSGDIEGQTQEGLIKEKYIFKGLKKGTTTIKFTFINTKNNSYGEVKKYRVLVDNNLNVYIKEITN